MTWSEFQKARLIMAEERVGSRIREQDRVALDEDRRSQELLRSRGMVG
jgi:hypothetical protein